MAKKISTYFSHDSNASYDPKCVAMIESLGWEGYGMYWFLLELLRNQSTYRYPVALIPALARRNNMEIEKVHSVVMDFDLFVMDENNHFFSASLLQRMETMEDIRNARIEAGKKSAEKRARSASSINDELMLSKCSTSAEQINKSKRKEKKVKEIKEKERNENIENSICSEQSDDYSEPEVFLIDMPLNDGGKHLITQEMVDKWTMLYPAVNVLSEIKKMIGWLDGNPKNRKTKQGIAKFINGWLARGQDNSKPERKTEVTIPRSERWNEFYDAAGYDPVVSDD